MLWALWASARVEVSRGSWRAGLAPRSPQRLISSRVLNETTYVPGGKTLWLRRFCPNPRGLSYTTPRDAWPGCGWREAQRLSAPQI